MEVPVLYIGRLTSEKRYHNLSYGITEVIDPLYCDNTYSFIYLIFVYIIFSNKFA